MSFGKHLRDLREARRATDPSFSLRRVAERIDVSPTFLSRLESGKETSVSEEVVLALAKELGEDPDVLLALGGKISTPLQKIILRRPRIFADLIKALKATPDEVIEEIAQEVRDGKW